MDRNMLTVGELSKLTGVSKQAIRYYDKIGLLKPGHVEPNGYRYYDPMHVLHLNSIMRLTQLGCSLEEAHRYTSGRDFNDVRNMLTMRRELIESRVSELQCAQNALNEQISQIDEGIQARSFENVHFRRYPERYFVYLESGASPDLKQGIMQVGLLVRELDSRGLLYVGSPVFEIKKDGLKTGYFMKTPLQGFKTDIIPAGEYACITHRGGYSNMEETTDRLKNYMASHELWPQTGIYQLFLIDYALTPCDEELVTELQVKVKD